GGRDLPVRAAEAEDRAEYPEVAEVLLGGHGLSPSAVGLSALAAARAEAGPDPVAALLLE
ncbi:MAG: hypothetical protein VYE77_07000, partial [Planctomycetota bacterium]|nr:hypothetical protein [Planctomycetota bacterium]